MISAGIIINLTNAVRESPFSRSSGETRDINVVTKANANNPNASSVIATAVASSGLLGGGTTRLAYAPTGIGSFDAAITARWYCICTFERKPLENVINTNTTR